MQALVTVASKTFNAMGNKICERTLEIREAPLNTMKHFIYGSLSD